MPELDFQFVGAKPVSEGIAPLAQFGNPAWDQTMERWPARHAQEVAV